MKAPRRAKGAFSHTAFSQREALRRLSEDRNRTRQRNAHAAAGRCNTPLQRSAVNNQHSEIKSQELRANKKRQRHYGTPPHATSKISSQQSAFRNQIAGVASEQETPTPLRDAATRHFKDQQSTISTQKSNRRSCERTRNANATTGRRHKPLQKPAINNQHSEIKSQELQANKKRLSVVNSRTRTRSTSRSLAISRESGYKASNAAILYSWSRAGDHALGFVPSLLQGLVGAFRIHLPTTLGQSSSDITQVGKPQLIGRLGRRDLRELPAQQD